MLIFKQLLLRFVDDFLFISTKRHEAKEFLKVMRNGFPEYGCSISESKTLVNFDVTFDGYETIKQNERNDNCKLTVTSYTISILTIINFQTFHGVAYS